MPADIQGKTTAMKILSVFGTRPEAIKMAPLVKALEEKYGIEGKVCVTAQHRQMLDQVLELFAITPDFDLDLMKTGQTLEDITAGVLCGMRDIFTRWRPDMVLVHGDTTTAYAASMAAYYAKIPVGHVEAGLRTGDKYAPWPEEMNRRIIDAVADVYFAPTKRAKENLLHEGIAEHCIFVTGNTGIDALLTINARIADDTQLHSKLRETFPFLDSTKKMMLVTGHRRENFGAGFEHICHALTEIARRNDVQIVYPVHMNPNVRNIVHSLLGNISNIFLIEPLDYIHFVYAMRESTLILTDSGGIQEEAPALAKPVLVMRDITERPEAIEAGTGRLVGTDKDVIIKEVLRLLDEPAVYAAMAQARNPYGDGTAVKHISDVLAGSGLIISKSRK